MTKKTMFKTESHIFDEVAAIYRWVDGEAAQMGQGCRACGVCCDFEAFGYRLYVTAPELLYFRHFVGPAIKHMPAGICPYRVEGKCSVYPYRFSGCRIFACEGDNETENLLSEQTVHKFKALCAAHQIPYHYVYLKKGLEMLREGFFNGLPGG